MVQIHPPQPIKSISYLVGFRDLQEMLTTALGRCPGPTVWRCPPGKPGVLHRGLKSSRPPNAFRSLCLLSCPNHREISSAGVSPDPLGGLEVHKTVKFAMRSTPSPRAPVDGAPCSRHSEQPPRRSGVGSFNCRPEWGDPRIELSIVAASKTHLDLSVCAVVPKSSSASMLTTVGSPVSAV